VALSYLKDFYFFSCRFWLTYGSGVIKLVSRVQKNFEAYTVLSDVAGSYINRSVRAFKRKGI